MLRCPGVQGHAAFRGGSGGLHWCTRTPLHPEFKTECLAVAAVFLVKQCWGSHASSWLVIVYLVPSKLFLP